MKIVGKHDANPRSAASISGRAQGMGGEGPIGRASLNEALYWQQIYTGE